MWPRVGALERALDLLFEVVSRGRFRDSPRGYPSAKDAWEEAIRAIRNLPEPGVPRHEMRRYIEELVRFGALSKNSQELTEKGKLLAVFTGISPFLSSAIVSVGSKQKEKRAAFLAGALVLRVMTTRNWLLI